MTRVRPHCSLAAAATALQWRCLASARSAERRSTDRSQTSGWIAAAPNSPAFSTSASMRSLAGTPIASVTAHASSRSIARPVPIRTSTALRPMRTISAGQSQPSAPLKSSIVSPG